MKRLALLAVLGAAMTGCTKQQAAPVVCDVLFKGVTAAAQGVASALSCANVPAIAATLGQPIANLNLCTSTQASGLVGDLICGQVADIILNMGLQQIPAAWQCTGGNIGTQAKQTITDKCKQAVPF